MNVLSALDLKGPEFLVWYLQMFALAGGAFFLLRWLLRRASDATPTLDLDTYEIAWLTDGRRGVVRAALASLYQRQLIDIQGARVVWREGAPAVRLPAIEEMVYQAVGRALTEPPAIERELEGACEEIEARLAQRGLALGPRRKALVRWIPPLAVLIVFHVGLAKLVMGLSRGRPVGLLVLLLAVSAVLIFFAARWRPRRTTAGDRLLDALAARHAALRTTLDTSAGADLDPADAGLAVALWGMGALGALAFIPLLSVFETQKAFAAGGSFGSGSSWFDGSSGGSGGGDSGGGGGCGGGGCGGGCGGCGS